MQQKKPSGGNAGKPIALMEDPGETTIARLATTIRTGKNKTRERSVAGKPATSAPRIVISQVVSVASCPRRFVRREGLPLTACKDVSQSSDTCLRCVASLRKDATVHVVPILILGGKKVLRCGSRDRAGRCRAVQER